MFAEVLPAIDRHDYEFLERQPEDARKGFSPPVVLRFASAAKGQYTDLMLLMVNGRANLDFYDLGAHPELQWRLLASCGLGVGMRHEWIAMPTSARSKGTVHGFLWGYWPDASESEITFLLNQFTRETFIDFTKECGLHPADEKAALDAYDKYTGHAPKKKASKPKKR